MQSIYLKILTVLLAASIIGGCDLQTSANTRKNTPKIAMVREKKVKTVWDRMSSNIQIKTNYNNPRVQYFIKQLTRSEAQNLIAFSEQAAPYLYHVVTLLEEQGLPSELALLPIVESEYKPHATSSKGAAGIWQLASMTGRLYGLKQDNWYDGRRDIDAATKVAIEHLQYLYEKFNHDWLLALAAYNCGDARLSQAIRKNKQLGKPTDYWSLSLPKETMYFVPKFLAITYLIQNSQKYGIALAPILNQPYFENVKLTAPIDFHTAANLAKLDVAEVKRLNPGYHKHTTHPQGPHQIALPVKHVPIFRANFMAQKIKTKPKPKQPTPTSNNTYTVHKGDTLNIIAAKYSTSVQAIKNKNNLKSDIIRSGQQLAI